MRKSIKSKSKRKRIIGGFAFFGGIALLTTGFAAWVFGVNQNASGSGVNVGSDTAINDTVFLDIKVDETDNKLILAEEVEHASKAPGEIAATQVNEDGLITFDPSGMEIDLTYTVVWGKDQGTPKAINFSLPLSAETEGIPEGVEFSKYANANIVTKAENVKYDSEKRKDLTYFETPVAINLTEAAKQAEAANPNAESYTLTATVKPKFKWGSFFGGESPLTFYNKTSKALYDKIGTDYTAQEYLNDATVLSQQATEELNIMHKLFDGKEIYLLATLEQ